MIKTRTVILLLSLLIPFLLRAQVPVISSFSPVSGGVGTLVVITGSNFSTVTSNNTVSFGGVNASVVSASTGSLTVVVPPGGAFKPISVTVNKKTGYSLGPFLQTFDGGGGFSATSFSTGNNFSTGAYPYEMATADFDADGKPDIAVINASSNSISVLRNQSQPDSILLGNRQDLATGSSPYSITVCDFDGDGKQDIAATNYAAATVSIFINTSSAGNISFASGINLATGTNPAAVATADFNRDGKPDIVVANRGSNTISVIKNTTNNGIISFAAAVSRIVSSLPISVATADLDGLGKTDIAVLHYGGTVSVFKNITTTDSIIMDVAANFPSGGGAMGASACMNICDADGDGKPDIITSNQTRLEFLKNNTNGGILSFTQLLGPSLYTRDRKFTTGDINGDGKPDILIGFSEIVNYAIGIKNISSTGNISFSGDYLQLAAAGDPKFVAMADFNIDGKPDIIAANSTTNNISVFKNKLAPSPSIISFSPASAQQGDTVTISGTGLSNSSDIWFGGVPATAIINVSETSVKAKVGYGNSGDIILANANGTDTIAGFTFIPPVPDITGIDPASGTSGTSITIFGTNFLYASSVTFGGVAANSFSVFSDTRITAIPGSGASGFVTVGTSSGKDSIDGFSYYLPPVITSFAPTLVTTEDTVTIKGRNFNGITTVWLGGTPAASFFVVSDSVIRAVVGGYNNSNEIYIASPGGEATLQGYSFYTHPPVLYSFTPNTGDSGTLVTIRGRYLIEVTAVQFGGTAAQAFTIVNDTTIIATVDNGTTGNVSVTNSTATISLPGFSFIPTYAPPVIRSFSPSVAVAGSTVVITGSDFSSTAANNVVFFGAVRATVTAASAGSLSVTVPAAASYGPVTVTVLPTNLTAISNAVFSPVFANADTSAEFKFKEEAALLTAGDPRRSAIADFDGDGKADIAVTNLAANTVSLFRNMSGTSSITFNPKTDFATANAPFGISAADITGDGKPDLILTHFPDFTVSNGIGVLKNISTPGNIAFADETGLSIAMQTHFRTIAVRDWDLNGKPDIAATDFVRFSNPGPSAPVSILRNTGSGGNIAFSPAQDYLAATYNLDAMCAADVDDDGKTDLVVSGLYNRSVAILRNTSTGGVISFAQAGTYPIGYEPGGLTAGDADGDGKPEILVTLKGYNVFAVFKNTSTPGNVSFAARQDINCGPDQEDIKLTDLDGDSRPDVVLTKRYSTAVHALAVYKNISTAAAIAFQYQNDLNTGVSPLQVNAGDLNADGRPDMIAVNSVSNTISIFRNQIGLPPVINTVFPLSAAAGATITIKGENFTNTQYVSFGGIAAASFVVVSDSLITAVVGNGTSGNINLISASGNALFPGFVLLSPKYVTQNGAGNRNGSNWSNAWGATELAANVYNQPEGSSIWVARGTYTPSRDQSGQVNANNTLHTFHLPAGVRLYGGFAGNELNIGDRKLALLHSVNKTIFSGDIGTAGLQDDNCAVVITITNAGQDEALDGISVSYAKSNAVRITMNSTARLPTALKNCVLSGNGPADASLVINGNSAALAKATISRCIFVNNSSSTTGAISATGGSHIMLDNCVFYNNSKTGGGNGASCIDFSGAAGTINNCNFIENSTNHAAPNGACITVNNGTDSILINNSVFWNNYNNSNITNTQVVAGSNRLSVKNCLFQAQTAGTAPAVSVNLLTGNPDFVAIADADGPDNIWATDDDGMQPLPYSLLVDGGNNNVVTGSADILNNPRIQFGTVDIGAYEIQTGTITLCPGAGTVLKSGIAGSSYQWQVNTGAGYTNIGNNSFYTGTNTSTLQLLNTPSSWYGYKYRCLADAVYSREFELRFSNNWTGAANNLWENTANWSCGTLPDANTDAVISTGNATVTSNPSVKSLYVRPGASVTVTPGFTVTVTGGLFSNGSLGGAPGNCNPITVNGNYKQGVPLNATNTLQVQVNVTATGSYLIFTNSANGISFSKAGTFTSTGLQTVILDGTGTPEFYGAATITVLYNSSACIATINITQRDPDYFPLVTNSSWSYTHSNSFGSVDSLYKKCIATNITYNGQLYRQFTETNEFLLDYNQPYRKSGTSYYQYFNNFDDLHSLLLLSLNGEIKFLDENLPTGGVWANTVRGWINGGSQNTVIQVQGNIVEKNVAVTLSTGLNFSNVTKVRMLYFDMSSGTPSIAYTEDRWYALGIGLVYYASRDPFGPCISYSLKRYSIY